MPKTKIQEIMITDMNCATLDDKFSDVKHKMDGILAHHVPIVEGKKLLGLVSRIDILMYTHSKAYQGNLEKGLEELDKSVSIKDIMTPISNLVLIKPTDTVKQAIKILATRGFHALPVVENGDQLVGLITTKLLLDHFLKYDT